MTTLTAVAAGGNWGSAGTWSPAQVPTAADDCIINASMTGTVSIDGTSGSPSLCRSLDCTGCTHTLSILGGKVLNIGDGSGGSLTLAAGMTFGINSTASINFVSTTTGNVITTGGQVMVPMNFNGAGGSWTLGDDLQLQTGCDLTLTRGTLNDGGHSVVSGTFSSNNSNTRALTMSGTWTVSSLWDIGNSTGMTLSAGSSTILIASPSTFAGGGLTYGTLSCTDLANGTNTITGANTFGALTLGNNAFNTSQVVLATNQTVTGTFTANGNSVLNRLYITSDTKGVSRTISAGTVSVSNIDMQDITGAGAGNWNIAGVTGGSGDCGRNSGITFTSPITCYMKTAVSVNWSASNWYTTSGGSTPARVPLPQDTARFDANSVTATGKTITLDSGMARISGMDWTSVANTPTLAFTASSLQYFGNIVFSSGMSASGSGTAMLDGGGGNITTSGMTWTAPITVDCGTGTWALLDNFTTNETGSGSTLDLVSGTLAIGAQTLTLSGSGAFLAVNGSTLSSTTGTVSLTGGGSAVFDLNSGTVSMINGTITTGSSALGLSGGSMVVGTLACSGQLLVGGADVQIGTGGATYSTIEVDSGSLAAISAHTLTVTGTAITVSSGGGGSGGGSWTFC
jgi:fibronectin-binding autotransporter adhesin